jgi:hypothetical protein
MRKFPPGACVDLVLNPTTSVAGLVDVCHVGSTFIDLFLNRSPLGGSKVTAWIPLLSVLSRQGLQPITHRIYGWNISDGSPLRQVPGLAVNSQRLTSMPMPHC